LTTPANAATAQNTALSLTWAVNPSATSYDVQVSLNSDFTTLFSSGNVTSNSYSLSGLVSGTTYYWRVAPKNATCTGTFGSPFSFTTGTVSCATFNSANVPVTIPTTVATVTSTLNVPSTSLISDVNVTLNITHTWINDLTLTLTSPTGTAVQLVVNPCTSANINNIAATFDDSGIAVVCGNSPGISGTVLPVQALSAFNGQNPSGTWTLTVADSFNQDGGSLNSWSVNICSIAPLSVEENTLSDFTLYPNPNNGNFNIAFTSVSEKPVSVTVYDMRGRQIYNNDFSNTGNFNQSINLDKVQSGVYLVNVTDGENKITKRIVIE
jgi:subtilisin-like proprotein convertase family protein